uniref:E3 ubiquitin-protein ligase n=1 Tax=Saccoglossus kowalevskii TaxID=10224 RepID=A0ABM0N122_SACKO|nr:PREDICTED: E3 ubiquitin-protein ligase DTX3L-like [Saccoglossus kowalevskii]
MTDIDRVIYPIESLFTTNYRLPKDVDRARLEANDPSPGSSYSGTSRTAYLPDNREGREVLRLLKLAFERKLTFIIGTSVTTGCNNTVVWNDIYHKTSMYRGPSGFGYQDDTYLKRVKEELAAKGVV